jgi:cytochrome c553
MKRLLNNCLLVLFIVVPGFSQAEEHARHQSVSPWSTIELHKTLAAMPEANITRGKQLHKDIMCASCHGEAGVAPSRNYPSLAGQRSEYTYKILLDYKAYRRNEGIPRTQVMNTISQLMSQQDMADVAVYYASLPLPKTTVIGEQLEKIEKLVRKGDPSRLITACASCHGVKGQGGINETPALAGQIQDYFISTMRAYKDGIRINDVEQGMAQFAAVLSEHEINALARYYSSLEK